MATALTGQEMSGEQGGVVMCLWNMWNCWRRVDLDIVSVQSKDSWLPMRILSNGVTLEDPKNVGLPAFGSPGDPIWMSFWGCASCVSVASPARAQAIRVPSNYI